MLSLAPNSEFSTDENVKEEEEKKIVVRKKFKRSRFSKSTRAESKGNVRRVRGKKTRRGTAKFHRVPLPDPFRLPMSTYILFQNGDSVSGQTEGRRGKYFFCINSVFLFTFFGRGQEGYFFISVYLYNINYNIIPIRTEYRQTEFFFVER